MQPTDLRPVLHGQHPWFLLTSREARRSEGVRFQPSLGGQFSRVADNLITLCRPAYGGRRRETAGARDVLHSMRGRSASRPTRIAAVCCLGLTGHPHVPGHRGRRGVVLSQPVGGPCPRIRFPTSIPEDPGGLSWACRGRQRCGPCVAILVPCPRRWRPFAWSPLP